MRVSEIFESDAYRPKSIVRKDLSQEELAQKAAAFIQKNCQPWLSESGGGIVYRGIHHEVDMPVFVKKIRTKRRPKDSSYDVNDAFNLLIDIAGGGATRNNSIFVSGSITIAEQYGEPYVVFPAGDFHYTWSPFFNDWFEDLISQGWYDEPTAKFKKLLKPGVKQSKDKYWSEIITDPDSYDTAKVKQAITPNQNLSQAIKSRHEISINANNAIYMNPQFYKNVTKYM